MHKSFISKKDILNGEGVMAKDLREGIFNLFIEIA